MKILHNAPLLVNLYPLPPPANNKKKEKEETGPGRSLEWGVMVIF